MKLPQTRLLLARNLIAPRIPATSHPNRLRTRPLMVEPSPACGNEESAFRITIYFDLESSIVPDRKRIWSSSGLGITVDDYGARNVRQIARDRDRVQARAGDIKVN